MQETAGEVIAELETTQLHMVDGWHQGERKSEAIANSLVGTQKAARSEFNRIRTKEENMQNNGIKCRMAL